ncbi:MAG: fatty acid desaturase [Candidatus Eremiobacteraeota bacterium]|nr:fatty acid desaturase [Candidatus Eremiobacteraeota bacterium]
MLKAQSSNPSREGDADVDQPKPHWPTAIGLAIIHLGALAAFWPGFFSWSAIGVMCALWYVTGGIGISLCFHRVLTHRSLRLPKALEYLTAFVGSLALEGGPIQWVATHRIHHAYTDREGDPHDAHRGLVWTHLEWMYRPNEARPSSAQEVRYAHDLTSDPVYRFLDRFTPLFQVVLAIALFKVGGWSWVIWGVFVRLVLVYHITWLVNSAAHRFGYRSYKTGDESTNCWWVALLTWGEGWHNNHHAFPFSARHGLRWYEFDASWLVIKSLKALGLASDIKLPTPAMCGKRAIALKPVGLPHARNEA